MIAAPISQFGNAMPTRGGELDERAPPALTGEGDNSSGNNSGWTPYLNAWPTGGNGSMDDYAMNSTYANITIGAYELVNGTDYTVEWEAWDLSDWTMVAGSSWSWVAMSSMEEHYADVASIGAGCYDFVGILHDDDAGSEIENETWPFSIDETMSECQNYTSGSSSGTNGTNTTSGSSDSPQLGIVSYQSENASSGQSCSDYDDSGCPLSIGDLDEGWVNITLEPE
jgi:hypothetical protein